MKYFMLLAGFLMFISCDTDSDIGIIKGDYTLESYTKLECDGLDRGLSWEGIESDEIDIKVSGTLEINFLTLFSQKLSFSQNNFPFDIEVKFIGACTQLENDKWIAEFSDSPFSSEDCDSAEITVENDTLIWRFTDEDGCEIIMVWKK